MPDFRRIINRRLKTRGSAHTEVKMSDITLSYTEKGNGFPLILLHGNGEDRSYFTRQIEYFSSTRRVVAVDTRGHGKTPRGEKPFTLNQFADDLHEFLVSMNIKKADTLGFSDGANIAIIFALKYPSFINKLILNGANIYPSGLKRYSLFGMKIGYGLCSLFPQKSKRISRRIELLSLMLFQPNVNPKELAAVNVPVLVIAGTNDVIKRKHTKLIADSIPDSQLVFIKGDHFIARKKYEKFNSVVETFLSE